MRTKNISPFMLVLLAALLLFPASMAFSEDDGIISYNTATAEELMQHEDLEVPEDIANAIVAYREKNGPFKSPAGLLKVPGITGEILEDLNPVVSEESGDIIYDPDAEPALAPSKC